MSTNSEREWLVPARITKDVEVIVTGETEEEALAAFAALEWSVDEASGSLVDWKVTGRIIENV